MKIEYILTMVGIFGLISGLYMLYPNNHFCIWNMCYTQTYLIFPILAVMGGATISLFRKLENYVKPKSNEGDKDDSN